jgi:sigma-B regulation protein RsbU (phosphoserine phosphatase)
MKSVLVVVAMALVMAAAAVTMSYRTYADTMDEHYERLTVNLARTAATQMDYARLQGYIATGQKDDEYGRLRGILKDIQSSNNVKYLYILQLRPDQGQTFTVMDTEDGVELGAIDELVQTMPEEEDALVYISNTETYGWLCSAMVSMRDDSGKTFAVMCVDISMNDVMADRYGFLASVIAVVCAIMAALGVMIVLLVGRFVVNPINRLAAAAGSFVTDRSGGETGRVLPAARHDPAVASAISRLDIRTGDEIESLSEAIKTMEREINAYIDDLTAVTAEKERIGAELDVARHIQSSLLPCVFPPFPDRTELDIYATMTPAKEVGGDFYDFFLIDDDRLAMVMADVSGKGVPAALFMVIAKTLLKNSVQAGLSPGAVLEHVNNQLCENNDAEMFVTVWLGILEISTGKLTCASAGHEYPILQRAGGAYELIKDKHGFVLAGMEGARYQEYELQLDLGDRLFLYTDGVTEATSADKELFGVRRMLEALNRVKGCASQELLRRVKEEIDAFVGDAPQFDDITMLGLERRAQGVQPVKELKLRPALEAIPQATAFVEAELESSGAAAKVIAQLSIAVDEILSNIAHYSGAAEAAVGIGVQDGTVLLRFADNGKPYDPTRKPDPDTGLPLEEREIGGLGIFMVKQFMDSVEYVHQDGLNILTLQKKLL